MKEVKVSKNVKNIENAAIAHIRANPLRSYKDIEKEIGIGDGWIARRKLKNPDFARRIEEFYREMEEELVSRAMGVFYEILDSDDPKLKLETAKELMKVAGKIEQKVKVSHKIVINIGDEEECE
ncbi:MAG: hypothetical protein ACRCXB_17850 [Aeromonadaceae bacterium]